MSTQQYAKSPMSRRAMLTIHDIREENTPSVYVRNRASKKLGVMTTVLIDHTHDGRTTVVDVPATFIPVDLTWFIPKDKLLDNPSFMQQVARGNLELVATAEALAELNTEVAQAELDRIRAMMEKRYPELQGDGDLDMRAIPPGQQPNGPTSWGDVNTEDIGVSSAVMEAMSREDMTDAERVAALRNLSDTMTDADRSFVRKNSQSQQILAAIS